MDHDGEVFLGFACDGHVGLDVLGTELAAMLEGLLMALWRGYQNFLLASDSQEVVSLVTGSGECWSNLGNLVEDVRNLLVHICKCVKYAFFGSLRPT
ncbi:unnamed protein product [Prunus armeniaca]